MTARAVVIGIDAYEQAPLQSCVRDAQCVSEALIELGLVRADDVTLLTAPAGDDEHLATSAAISRALFAVYDKGAELDRLYVFYSGHGLMAQVGAARARLANYVIPCDVKDPRFEGNLLLNVDDLRDRLRLAGPREQFLFFDCCRNVAWGDPPELGPLAWPRTTMPSDEANAQATLFAVSPRGKAIARDGETSLVTEHLLDALHGRGQALDWSEADGAYVVTIDSMRNHMRQAVRAAIATQPLWGRDHVLPDCEVVGTISPLRTVDNPEPVPLTVNIEPASAAAATRVRLTKGGDVLAEPAWPPQAAGAEVMVRPQRFGIRAESDAGAAAAEPAVLDARVVSVAVVRVGEPAPVPAPPEHAGPSQAEASSTGITRGVEGDGTAAEVKALAEPHVSIEVRALDPPYLTRTGVGSLAAEVPAGFYRVRFRLGTELFSEREIEVAAGEELLVRPNVISSPLLHETLAWDAPQRDAVVSPTIGPMQGGAVETMLAMLALKPFDARRQLFGRFHDLVPPLAADELGHRPLSIVVALDGGPWPAPVPDILGGLRAEVRAGDRSTPVPLRRLRDEPGGLGRVALGVVALPAPSVGVRLQSAHLGTIDLAAFVLEGRVGALAVLVLPNGSLLVTQQLLPFPAEGAGGAGAVPFGVLVRQLTVGQQLYRAGELVSNGTLAGGPLGEILQGTFVDPVVSAMAGWAWLDAGKPEVAATVTGALTERFGALPDAAVLAAAVLGDRRPLDAAGDVAPLLARSCHELAALPGAPPAGGGLGRPDPMTVWNLTWEPT